MSRTLGTMGVAFCVLAVIVSTSGCSDPYATVPVSGRLTLDGEPVEGAQVLFTPIDAPDKTGRPAGKPGKASRGAVGADGTFTLAHDDGQAGAVLGPHRVLFEPPPTRRPTIPGSERELMTEDEIRETEAQIAAMPIYPALPSGVKIAPAEVEVTSGQNNFEFTLSK